MPLGDFLAILQEAGDPYADSSRFISGDMYWGKSKKPAFEPIIEFVRPSVIFEVGSWKGDSANTMADLCRAGGIQAKIICIDTFLGSIEHWTKAKWRPDLHVVNGRPTIFERFMGNVVSRGNQDMILPFPIPSLIGAQVLRKHGVTADLIYIDASHSYEDVLADIAAFHSLLNSGGYIFGDDFRYPPVAQAVHDFAARIGNAKVLTFYGQWIIVPPEVSIPEFVPA